MDDGEDAAADALGRIFSGISEAQRRLGAQPEPGDKATSDQQRHARSECAEDGEGAEQEQVELIDESAAEPVGEFALAGSAEKHAENGGAADGRGLRSGCEFG